MAAHQGPRDSVAGLVGVVMLLFFGPAPAAVVILVEALIPIGDALMVIRNRGRLSAAIGIHLATAAAMVVAAILLLA